MTAHLAIPLSALFVVAQLAMIDCISIEELLILVLNLPAQEKKKNREKKPLHTSTNGKERQKFGNFACISHIRYELSDYYFERDTKTTFNR